MKQVTMLKCIEAYEVTNIEQLEHLPIIYRQNRMLGHLVSQYDLVIDKGLIYACDKQDGVIKYVFSAFRSWETNPELSCKYFKESFTKDKLIKKLKGN